MYKIILIYGILCILNLALAFGSPVQVMALSSLSGGSKHFLTFKEWKSGKTQEVQQRIDWIKAKIEQKKVEIVQKRTSSKTELALAKQLGLPPLENQLKSESYNLEMAQELTFTDYFAGYVNRQENKKEAFHEVAAKLSSDEVFELMTAYSSFLSANTFPIQAEDLSSEKTK